MVSVSVDRRVFEALPNLSIFVAVIRNIEFVDKKACEDFLDKAWNSLPEQIKTYANVQSHPRIAAWRQTYSSLGISVKKYTSSIENLAKRASKVGLSPLHINPIVDLYNGISLSFLVPFGGFDLDVTEICQDLQLRYSEPGDTFLALDAEDPIPIPTGEVLYAYKNTVVTRHINWKQSREGLILPSSKNVILMAEVLDQTLLSALVSEITEKCQQLLHVTPETWILDKTTPGFSFHHIK